MFRVVSDFPLTNEFKLYLTAPKFLQVPLRIWADWTDASLSNFIETCTLPANVGVRVTFPFSLELATAFNSNTSGPGVGEVVIVGLNVALGVVAVGVGEPVVLMVAV